MLSTLRAIPRHGVQHARLQSTKAASAPLMWRMAHGAFEFDSDMTRKYPHVPDSIPMDPPAPTPVSITELPNGVRVCSTDLGGPVSSLGLYVGAGSRDENPHTAGITHAIEKMSFKGSATRSTYRMQRDIERSGAMYNTMASRDVISFTAEGLRGHTAEMADLLADAALAPIVACNEPGSVKWDLASEEIKKHAKAMKANLKDVNANGAARVTEAMHAAAFSGNSLGLPLIAEERKLDMLTPETFSQFISATFGSDNIVLSAANVAHDELVNIAQSTLGSLTPKNLLRDAKYTGGAVNIAADGPAHVAIGFEGVSWNDSSLVPACVLYALLGGGGSFSSGGPGKGMYTRLYSQVLNRYAWVSSCVAVNHVYSDGGLFGIHASCDDPAKLNNLVEVVGSQLGKLAEPLENGELERAKAMTKSALVMNLESRNVIAEDIGRQILNDGKYVTKEELCKKIDAVTEDDIRQIAARMLSSKPAIVKYGEEFASYDTAMIENAIKAQAKITA